MASIMEDAIIFWIKTLFFAMRIQENVDQPKACEILQMETVLIGNLAHVTEV